MYIRGETITDIADKLNRSRQTIYDWLKKPNVKFELDRRRQDLANQGNALILKDVKTYIGTIKDLAKDKSDKRVALAANQYLLNRVFGSPVNNLMVSDSSNDNVSDSIGEIEKAIESLRANNSYRDGAEIVKDKANKLDG